MQCILISCLVKEIQMQYLQQTTCRRDIWRKRRNPFFASVDLQKAFGRVPRWVVKQLIRKLGVYEWCLLISAVMTMYRNTSSVIRVNNIVRDKFDVKVEDHNSSVLGPLLFVIVFWIPLQRLQKHSTLGDLTQYDAWKHCMEGKGLRVNLTMTKVMISDINIYFRKAVMWSLL